MKTTLFKTARPRGDEMLKGKKRKSKIVRGTGQKSNMYFNDGTSAAISAYQATSDEREREKLYNSEILPAFDKLVENLIFIHGFQGLHDSYEDLKNDCITFLYEAIHKFDPTRGSKPFSYFNVVAKNWLIIRSKQRMTKLKRSVSIDDPESLARRELEAIEGHHVIPAQDENLLTQEFIENVHAMLDEIRKRVLNENELACIDSIITIFKNVENIDLLNKRAVFLYIRELSGLSPKQLTTTIASIKKHYRDLKLIEEFSLY